MYQGASRRAVMRTREMRVASLYRRARRFNFDGKRKMWGKRGIRCLESTTYCEIVVSTENSEVFESRALESFPPELEPGSIWANSWANPSKSLFLDSFEVLQLYWLFSTGIKPDFFFEIKWLTNRRS